MAISDFGQKIGLTRIHLISKFFRHDEKLNFFEYIDHAAKVLICLPVEEEGFINALSHTNQFSKLFPNARITFLYWDQLVPKDKIRKPFSVITYDFQVMNRLGLPSKEFRRRIYKDHYHVVIDLNLSFNYIQTALVWESKSKIRICFDHPQREELYNFIIRLEPENSWEGSIKSFFKVLGMR
jgi:hypothetical protein